MIEFGVVIPAYNAEHTILNALTSCVNQSCSPKKIIVVDDCSTDNTVEIVEQFIQENDSFTTIIEIMMNVVNLGPAASRNKAWDALKDFHVAFLDADDIWASNKLDVLSEIVKANSDCALIGHDYTLKKKFDVFEGEKIQSAICTKQVTYFKLLLKNMAQTSCVLVRGDVPQRFDESMRYTEDHDLWLRISDKHKVLHLQMALTCLGRPQLAKGGLSGNRVGMRLGELKMFVKAARSKFWVAILLPFLIMYSLLKHVYKYVSITIK